MTKAEQRRPISRQMLADHVHEELLASLIDGRLEAGQGLSIDGIARDLGVSPTPVREALARLEHTGMVQRLALKGYRVAPLFSSRELEQLIDARLVIEPANAEQACARAARKPGGDFPARLAEIIERHRNAPTGSAYADFREYWQADEDFHRLIAEYVDNPFLLAAYNALGGQVQRFRFFAGLGVTDSDAAVAEHEVILRAFQAGDPAAARAAMQAHLQGVRQRSIRDSVEHP